MPGLKPGDCGRLFAPYDMFPLGRGSDRGFHSSCPAFGAWQYPYLQWNCDTFNP